MATFDLRTDKAAAIEPHVEYYAGRTESWNWFGEQRWWEKWLVWLDGWDGCGQYVCEIRWRWNGSQETLRRDYVHLSESDLRSEFPPHRPAGNLVPGPNEPGC